MSATPRTPRPAAQEHDAPMLLAPHRLLPADPAARRVAWDLYEAVREAPIYSPHGHVDPALLLENARFTDPSALLVTPDHYVTRLLHAHGVPLDRLGLGGAEATPGGSREIWRLLCAHWHQLAGTTVRYWLTDQLAGLFGVRVTPSEETADAVYDQVAAALDSDAFRPRALFERFRIRVLATTDDPADSLAAHRALRDDPAFAGAVIPTFRPDRYLDPGRPGWRPALADLAAAADEDCGTYRGLLAALRRRRGYFAESGATATDTGVPDAAAEPLPAEQAERIHRDALAGPVPPADADAYRRDLVFRLAEMSCDDGLVMQLHPGVVRNHHRPTFERYGPDTGHDLPAPASFTGPLRPLLDAFGTHPALHLVLFTVDETAFAREIAPLAGFYPSVYAGAPWWFLDTPSAMARYRSAVTDAAGFAKTSGFVDDTRAFCSIPTRHDTARRADAAYLAGLVTTHQLDEAEATRIVVELVRDVPVRAFKLASGRAGRRGAA